MEGQNRSFDLEKQRAVERMRELNARAKNIKNACEPQRTLRPDNNIPPQNLGGINIPFLKDIGIDADISLILGLALILMAEDSDKLLLLALLYILI